MSPSDNGLMGPPGSKRRRFLIRGVGALGAGIIVVTWFRPASEDNSDPEIWAMALMFASAVFFYLDSILTDVRWIRDRLDKAIGQEDKT